jgi:hypothetical protein
MGRQKQSFDELIIAINYNHKIQTKRRMSDAGKNWLLLSLLSRGVFMLIRDSANAVPATKNYAPEISTFGAFAGVSLTVVQWKGLILGEPPS